MNDLLAWVLFIALVCTAVAWPGHAVVVLTSVAVVLLAGALLVRHHRRVRVRNARTARARVAAAAAAAEMRAAGFPESVIASWLADPRPRQELTPDDHT